MKKNNKAPHYKVYTRLRPSDTHGVGVFAIRDIPKGTDLFCDEAEQNLEVEGDKLFDKKEIDKFDPEIRKLYNDFCVIENGKYNCPGNFDLLTVGWYINQSNRPNVKQNDNGSFKTLRKIKKSEELTTDYRKFSEEPPHKWLNNKLPKRKNDKIRDL